jgi:hypothetical protein
VQALQLVVLLSCGVSRGITALNPKPARARRAVRGGSPLLGGQGPQVLVACVHVISGEFVVAVRAGDAWGVDVGHFSGVR